MRSLQQSYLVACLGFIICLTASSFSIQKNMIQNSVLNNAKSITSLSSLPSLIVFDLDNTLWEPELYQLRRLQRQNIRPIAGRDVKLFPAAQSIIESIRASPDEWSGTKFAVASRTKSVEWAQDLIKQFGLDDFFDYIEIFPSNKKQHFNNLKENSGINFENMLFFDDARDGRFGNCVPVSEMGVLSVHCPRGLIDEWIWTNALEQYKNHEKQRNRIVEWDGTVTEEKNERLQGTIKMVNNDKKYGFIQYGNSKTKDLFFHFSSLPQEYTSVEKGDEVSFNIFHDSKKGKDAAEKTEILSPSSDDLVQMRVFSMNMPFAALLANHYKTLETRNGTMFTPYPEGTKMLLHVGQRNYPDGDRHIDVMKSGGLNESEINALKTLPKGFGKGMAVAIVELGKTFETSLEERCDPDFQRKVGAFGEDSGMRATEIKRVEYLKRGVRVSGKGGVFKVNINRDDIPEGWL